MIHTSTEALRRVEALEHFANAYGIALPADVAEARKAALQISREARMRPAHDMNAAARAAVGTDISKAVKALAKDAATDRTERDAMTALVTAYAKHAASLASAATYNVVESALTGSTIQRAADDLAALAAEGHLPILVGEDSPDDAIVHARARRAEKVGEVLAAKAAALPGFGSAIEYPVLIFLDPTPALDAGHTHSAVRASVRGVTGGSDVAAWQRVPMSAFPEYRPVNPTSVASILLLRRGATVRVADSLAELDRRVAAVGG